MPALKQILLGKPLSSADEHHQRLSKKIALPVFACDAISSTAYATDEILVVLAAAGRRRRRRRGGPSSRSPSSCASCWSSSWPVYRQTIHAYPAAAAATSSASENLGKIPSLVAGSSLLVDYILTVAVSRGRRRAGHPHGHRPRHEVGRAALPAVRAGHDRGQPARREGVGRRCSPARPTSTS